MVTRRETPPILRPVFRLVPTDPAWATAALEDLDALLADHLHCERKAAASALSLVRSYPQHSDLVLHLSRLAQEEAGHMVEVSRRLRARRASAVRDAVDAYAQALRRLVRRSEPHRLVDLLLTSGLIEARSAERLALLAEGLRQRGEPQLATFYADLAATEARHRDLFASLARAHGGAAAVDRARLLCEREAEVVATLPWGPRIH